MTLAAPLLLRENAFVAAAIWGSADPFEQCVRDARDP
jgi:hypothetical protein